MSCQGSLGRRCSSFRKAAAGQPAGAEDRLLIGSCDHTCWPAADARRCSPFRKAAAGPACRRRRPSLDRQWRSYTLACSRRAVTEQAGALSERSSAINRDTPNLCAPRLCCTPSAALAKAGCPKATGARAAPRPRAPSWGAPRSASTGAVPHSTLTDDRSHSISSGNSGGSAARRPRLRPRPRGAAAARELPPARRLRAGGPANSPLPGSSASARAHVFSTAQLCVNLYSFHATLKYCGH